MNGISRILKLQIFFLALVVPDLGHSEFPVALQSALNEFREQEEISNTSVGVLRRYSASDSSLERLAARVALSRYYRNENNHSAAFKWVFEYREPLPEYIQWPFVTGFVEAAVAEGFAGETFSAVSRLKRIEQSASGLEKVAVLRGLSELVEIQPNLASALKLEEESLAYGRRYFKRETISASAGLAAEREGAKEWKRLVPEIENRIADLKRRLEIEKYGLDFVLYRMAQNLRNASHPLSMDFTDVALAFREKGVRGTAKIPKADFTAARDQYLEIVTLFPEGAYTEASRLYAAVCLIHMEDHQKAIRELVAFYQQDPEGIFRGEALKILGDVYLVRHWDARNAQEAYTRAAAWCETVQNRARVLDTYLVPEKSRTISRPPKRVKTMGAHGVVRMTPIGNEALVNRTTVDWYLPTLRSEVEWKLGFLSAIAGDSTGAQKHFDLALQHDKVMKIVKLNRYHNSYDRLLKGVAEGGVLVGKEEEMRGLNGKAKLAMQSADLHFMLERFDAAQDLYRRIQEVSLNAENEHAYVRSILGEVLLRSARRDPGLNRDTRRLYEIAMRYPQAHATPYLLYRCAFLSREEDLDGYDILKQVYMDYPRSRMAAEARYQEIVGGFLLSWEEEEKRIQMIKAFIRDFPNEEESIKSLWRVDEIAREQTAIMLQERLERKAAWEAKKRKDAEVQRAD